MPLTLYDLGETKENKGFEKLILSLLNSTKELNALEIGIGNGRFGSFLAKHFKEYYGIDKSEDYLKEALKSKPENAIYTLAEAEKIPFEMKFDMILFAHSFHLTNLEATLKEAREHLNENGIIIFIETNSDNPNFIPSRMNPKSSDFDKKMYDKKIGKITRAKEFLDKNCTRVQNNSNFNVWILK